MAYTFNGTNQYLSATYSPATPVTIFASFYLNANNKYQEIVGFAHSTGSLRARELRVTDTNTLQLQDFSGTGVTGVTTSATISTSTWHYAIGQILSSTSRKVQLNLNALTSTTASNTLPESEIPKMAIGVFPNSPTPQYYIQGRVAEVAIWGAELNADEIISLNRGFRPSRIRPQSLLMYVPLVRNMQDLRNSLALTNNNTATAADHPRRYG